MALPGLGVGITPACSCAEPSRPTCSRRPIRRWPQANSVAHARAGQLHVGVQEAARAGGRRARHHDHRRLRRRPCRGHDGGRRHRRHRPPASDCDRFAAFNGTAAIEVSSGGSKLWRVWGTAHSTTQFTWPSPERTEQQHIRSAPNNAIEARTDDAERCSYGLSRVDFGDGAGRPVMGHSSARAGSYQAGRCRGRGWSGGSADRSQDSRGGVLAYRGPDPPLDRERYMRGRWR